MPCNPDGQSSDRGARRRCGGARTASALDALTALHPVDGNRSPSTLSAPADRHGCCSIHKLITSEPLVVCVLCRLIGSCELERDIGDEQCVFGLACRRITPTTASTRNQSECVQIEVAGTCGGPRVR